MTPEDNLQPTTNNEQQEGSAITASPLKQIRTYQGDIAEALHTQNESLVSIERAEHARRPSANIQDGQDKTSIKKTLLLIVGTIVLVGGGAAGGWYSYKEYKVKTALPVIAIPDNRFIASREIDLDASGLDRTNFIEKIGEILAGDIQAGEIAQIELRNGPGDMSPLTETSRLHVIIESGAPGSLVRALDPLFMLGVVGGEEKSTFLLFKLTSFENAYAGMLQWETSLAKDIGPILNTKDAIANSANATDTPIFQDISIENKDAREIRDADGKTLMLYSFFDNQWLIITDSESTLKSVIDHLTSEKLSR